MIPIKIQYTYQFFFQLVSGMGTVLLTSSGEPYSSEERCNSVLDTFSAEDELNCSKY